MRILYFIFGTMSKLFKTSFLLIFVACNSGENEKVLSDEIHRAVDWKSNIEMVVELDTTQGEMSDTRIIRYSSSKPFLELVDQLYDMAFSGDAKVYAPTLFGEVDFNKLLDPKSLLDEIQDFDTIVVEDVFTGKKRDTVVDLSFRKSHVSAVVITCAIPNQPNGAVEPKMVSLGKQVLDETSGQRRGVKNEFFMSMGMEDDQMNEPFDRLHLFSDSLGQINLHSWSVYRQDSPTGLSEWLILNFPDAKRVRIRFDIELDNENQRIYFSNWSMSPAEIDPAA